MLFLLSGMAFDLFMAGYSRNEFGWTVYYAGAATVDCLMYRCVEKFLSGSLRRDIEALCIASICINALGWAMYLAYSPPELYNKAIAGVNYALAMRLIVMGGGDVFNYSYWRDLVRSVTRGRSYLASEKAE